MSTEPHSFDREAFRAAVKAAAQPKLAGVTLPGIGSAWVRPLTAGDWVDAHSARRALEKQGVDITPRLHMAIGLAQNLCGPSGEAIFSPSSLEDLQMLADLPMDVVADAMAKAGDVNAAPGVVDPNA